MLKEALQYIIGLQQPRVEEIDGQKYFFTRDGMPLIVDKCRNCETLKLSTLTSLVEYIKGEMDAFLYDVLYDEWQMIVHVVSETEVKLVSQLNGDLCRWEVADVLARVPKISFNDFMEQERFIIQMQSMFLDTPDKAIVMKVAGNVEDRTVANYGDDGVTQKATINSGIASKEDVLVPNPVVLKPFRTFHEVEQPEIAFVFRMRNTSNGVGCALFEADGGAWKFNTVHGIAQYLKAELADMPNIAVLS